MRTAAQSVSRAIVRLNVSSSVIVLLLLAVNGYFVGLAECNEDYREMMHIKENVPPAREEVSTNSLLQDKDLPKFGERLQNMTIPVGREALLICVVDNLQTYKIAWLRVDTQTILTIQTHVITKNHRMVITHAEKRKWILKIRDVKEADMGWYMCQINTDPMKSQVAYLDVVVPPDILDYPTSTDMVVREGSNVTLKCAANGSPPPTITWRREGGEPIDEAVGSVSSDNSFNGSTFTLTRVDRLKMGAYLCIASNGIPPSVSKRVMLIVHFPPMIWIQNQLVGAATEQNITLECQSEAFPKSLNYWAKEKVAIIQGDKYIMDRKETTYKTLMTLTIVNVDISDFGTYNCLAKNSLGETDGAIKVYHIPHTTVSTILPTATITLPTVAFVAHSTTIPFAPRAAADVIASRADGSPADKSVGRKSYPDNSHHRSNAAPNGVWNPEIGRERVSDQRNRQANNKNALRVSGDHRSTVDPSTNSTSSNNNTDQQSNAQLSASQHTFLITVASIIMLFTHILHPPILS